MKNNKTFSKFSKSKLNDKTIYSDDFSVDVFKEKLTLLNKELKSNTIDKEIVLFLINKYFFDNKINIEREVKRGQKYYKYLIIQKIIACQLPFNLERLGRLEPPTSKPHRFAYINL